MDFTTILIAIAVIYGVLLFFDNFFKTCAHYPYIRFLEGTGFKIGFFSLRWTTRAFNRTLIRWGNSRPRFLHIWFTTGFYVSLVLLPISMILLLYSLEQNVFSDVHSSEPKIVLEPIVPGVNLPASELGYYSSVLILCSIFHEVGHALAAVSENVNLIEVGANLWFIVPAAFVQISTDKFASMSRKRRLKILCAGIWHNIVLSLVAFTIYSSLPFIFSPFYELGEGITISAIAKKSPLLGERGLKVGDTVNRLNECYIFDEVSWYDCLRHMQEHKPAFCVESNLIHSLDESVPLRHLDNGYVDCCDSKKSSNICFEYVDSADRILEIPSHVCLPGRKVVEKSTNFCSYEPDSCPENFYCFRPLLANETNLFKISGKNKNVIYLGHSLDIYRTVDVSIYIPDKVFTTTVLPDMVTKFVSYMTVFSLGLAVINTLPFINMDGQYIVEIVGMVLFKNIFGKNGARTVTSIIMWFFSFLLVLHCLYSAGKLLL